MIKIKIDPRSGSSYFPKEVRQEGFVGEVEGLVSALTLTLMKPRAGLADIEKGLEIVLQDVHLRIQHEEDAKLKTEEGRVSRNLPAGQRESASGKRHPVFVMYSRDWLHGVTHYSLRYLCRMATGKVPVSRSFKERACFKLGRPEGELFLVDASEEGQNANDSSRSLSKILST